MSQSLVKVSLVVFVLTLHWSNAAYSQDLDSKLVASAKRGATAEMPSLLAGGAQVNARDESGWTPLMWAVWEGHIEAATFLIANGANVNAKRNDGTPVLMVATSYGSVELVRLLIARGADVKALGKNGETLLMEIAWLGDTETAKALLAQGFDVNAKDKSGRTALFRAASRAEASLDMIKFLIGKGAKADVRDLQGWTPLMLATSNLRKEDLLEGVKLLLDRNAEVNAVTKQGHTALMQAAKAGDPAVLRLLMTKGADVNFRHKDSQGKIAASPLMFAAALGHADAVRVLLDAGADPNARDFEGQSVLSVAKGQVVVDLLKKYGAKQ